ncbi:hypothetical protein S7711_00261 [Stachybotrys chartarum IBT 7711]|uniref:Heterokaryon incompatibility domain-containing protein n=1 Tax=Stachybotrys chartarum (strain CBS 109288 / IBT 7711) TaxID=1280523 RepID=A0A084B3Y3_STACB|nr:hypothetical protein S7711_00261 [Stachybotrys chartarum IBT 7711]
MSKTHPPYCYEPLSAGDCVRIIILHPARLFSDPLECDLLQESRAELLSDPVKADTLYTAISYTWGQPLFSRQLYCNEGSSVIGITENVDTILRHLRKRTRSQHLWLDAICLNQADEMEKAQQIPLMGDIYRQAKKVRIWLGDADEETPRVLAFLRVIASITEDPHGLLQRVYDTARNIFNLETLTPVERFLRRPWFWRRWILQEAALARQAVAHCGSHRIPWPNLTAASATLQRALAIGELNPPIGVDDNTLSAIEVVTSLTRLENQRMLPLLWQFHTAECGDKKDRIFALYGLLPAGERNPVQIDYNSEWVDIFREQAFTNVMAGRGTELLAHLFAFGPLSSSDSSSPSWVPNWNSKRNLVISRLLAKEPGEPGAYFKKLLPLQGLDNLLTLQRDDGGSGAQVEDVIHKLQFQAGGTTTVSAPVVTLTSPSFDWKDVKQCLSSIAAATSEVPGAAHRVAFALLSALQLTMGPSYLARYTRDHWDKARRVELSMDDDMLSGICQDLGDIWNKISSGNSAWDPGHISLLQAIGSVLQESSVFYLKSYDCFGLGPPSLQEGHRVCFIRNMEYSDLEANSIAYEVIRDVPVDSVDTCVRFLGGCVLETPSLKNYDFGYETISFI